ncbi:unnamed protein product [Tenebrio molitor]|nr:unnamed protein product [Tenebrio molitor]
MKIFCTFVNNHFAPFEMCRYLTDVIKHIRLKACYSSYHSHLICYTNSLETKPSEYFPSFLQVGFLNLPVEDFVDRTLFTVKTH